MHAVLALSAAAECSRRMPGEIDNGDHFIDVVSHPPAHQSFGRG